MEWFSHCKEHNSKKKLKNKNTKKRERFLREKCCQGAGAAPRSFHRSGTGAARKELTQAATEHLPNKGGTLELKAMLILN